MRETIRSGRWGFYVSVRGRESRRWVLRLHFRWRGWDREALDEWKRLRLEVVRDESPGIEVDRPV